MIPTHRVHHRGGDIFDVFKEPSDRCVLWGELVKDKERRFLGKTLQSELVCFSVRDTFQISVRTCWRPESLCIHRHHRKGRFAMLLHDTRGRLTTSWTWLKLVKPLYKIGLSVILVDLPGLGKSSINNVSTLHPSVWQEHEGHILCQILDELKISKCHLVACGSSCSALIRISKHLPHQLEKEHILHNPVLDFSELFKEAVPGPAPDTGPNWRDILRAGHQRELENFLVASEVRIFATFDDTDFGRTRETFESFASTRNHCLLCETVSSKEVSKEDICEVQVGADVPVSFLFVGKELREGYAQFLQQKLPRDQPRNSLLQFPREMSEEINPFAPLSPVSSSLEREATPETGGRRAPRPSLAAIPNTANKSRTASENVAPLRTAGAPEGNFLPRAAGASGDFMSRTAGASGDFMSRTAGASGEGFLSRAAGTSGDGFLSRAAGTSGESFLSRGAGTSGESFLSRGVANTSMRDKRPSPGASGEGFLSRAAGASEGTLLPRAAALTQHGEEARQDAPSSSAFDARNAVPALVVPWSAPHPHRSAAASGPRHKMMSTDTAWAKPSSWGSSTESPGRHPAAGSEWSGSTTNGTMSSTARAQKSSYTADSAKREALGKMRSDPHESRRKLLSTLPGRWRHKILSFRTDQAVGVGQIEPENNQEERSMVVEAVRASLQTLAEENQARRQSKKPQRVYLGS